MGQTEFIILVLNWRCSFQSPQHPLTWRRRTWVCASSLWRSVFCRRLDHWSDAAAFNRLLWSISEEGGRLGLNEGWIDWDLKDLWDAAPVRSEHVLTETGRTVRKGTEWISWWAPRPPSAASSEVWWTSSRTSCSQRRWKRLSNSWRKLNSKLSEEVSHNLLKLKWVCCRQRVIVCVGLLPCINLLLNFC